MVLVHTVIVHLERTLLNRSHISEPKGLEKSCRISRRTKSAGPSETEGCNGKSPFQILAEMAATPTPFTLIGMRQGTFHPLSFLDQDVSTDFLSQILNKKLEVRIEINQIVLTLCQAH